MKIALVSPYDFAYPGGVTNHISCLGRHFTEMGHEVKIIAPVSKVTASLDDRFIPIGKPRSIPTSGSIARITISPWLSSQVEAVMEAERFDVVHLHEPLMPMLSTTVLRMSHAANIGTFHAYGFNGRPGYNCAWPLGKWLLSRWFHKLDGKIAVSKPAMEFARHHFPGYYNVIPNGIDLEHFSPDVPPIDEFCDGKLNILFVGRLEKRKGMDYLLGAYQRVKAEIPNLRLIAVGPGTRLGKQYKKQVARSGLEDVVFVGYADYNDLPRYYRTADVFCAPATGWESFGIVLLEAMATGTPVVATNIEGYSNVINDGVEGLLVPPKNKDRLAEALLRLLGDEALRRQMGAAGKLKALEYGWGNISKRVLDYYHRVLSETPWQKGQGC